MLAFYNLFTRKPTSTDVFKYLNMQNSDCQYFV